MLQGFHDSNITYIVPYAEGDLILLDNNIADIGLLGTDFLKAVTKSEVNAMPHRANVFHPVNMPHLRTLKLNLKVFKFVGNYCWYIPESLEIVSGTLEALTVRTFFPDDVALIRCLKTLNTHCRKLSSVICTLVAVGL